MTPQPDLNLCAESCMIGLWDSLSAQTMPLALSS
jgi:hypothetical protein